MSGRAPSWFTALTPRETEVVRLMADDLSNAEIAERLVVSPQTVKWYVREIYSKLGVHSRDEALAMLDALEPPGGAQGHRDPSRAAPRHERCGRRGRRGGLMPASSRVRRCAERPPRRRRDARRPRPGAGRRRSCRARR